jgi:hypothetical protein
MNVDGNLMRVKIFKNGNAHFEIHPTSPGSLTRYWPQYACSYPGTMSKGANNKGAKRVRLHPEDRI